MKEEIIRLEKITQITDGVTLLDSLNLHIFKNEIFGLLCINDHGKEALIQLICRNIPINFGNVYFLDLLTNSYKRHARTANEVLVIEKPIRLIEDLRVADNVFLLRHRNKQHFNDQLYYYIEKLGLQIDPAAWVADLSFYEKCLVLLLKAYIMDTKLVILRDISNFISAVEMKKIDSLLKKLVNEGMTFLYICNNHEEAFKICDRVALMENGRVIKILDNKNFSDEVIKAYTLDFYHNTEDENSIKENSGTVLSFKGVSTDNIKDMSFDIYKGECVTFLDINNTVLNDIIDLLGSSFEPDSGEIELEGVNSRRGNLLKKNIEIIVENPTQTMVFMEMSCIDNLCFLVDKKLSGVWAGKKIKRSVMSEYEEYFGEDLYATDIYGMSIGSLYNLVYYRIHLLSPKIAVCVQPFSGADMYLRHQIICLINKLLEKGISVIILAVNISDTLFVSDRLFVVEKGRLKEEYSSRNFHKFKRDN